MTEYLEGAVRLVASEEWAGRVEDQFTTAMQCELAKEQARMSGSNAYTTCQPQALTASTSLSTDKGEPCAIHSILGNSCDQPISADSDIETYIQHAACHKDNGERLFTPPRRADALRRLKLTLATAVKAGTSSEWTVVRKLQSAIQLLGQKGGTSINLREYHSGRTSSCAWHSVLSGRQCAEPLAVSATAEQMIAHAASYDDRGRRLQKGCRRGMEERLKSYEDALSGTKGSRLGDTSKAQLIKTAKRAQGLDLREAGSSELESWVCEVSEPGDGSMAGTVRGGDMDASDAQAVLRLLDFDETDALWVGDAAQQGPMQVWLEEKHNDCIDPSLLGYP